MDVDDKTFFLQSLDDAIRIIGKYRDNITPDKWTVDAVSDRDFCSELIGKLWWIRHTIDKG